MKRIFCVLLIFAFVFSSCAPVFSKESRSAQEILEEILTEFAPEDGYCYSMELGAPYPLTDALLERMFSGRRLEDLRYVDSMAVYFSKSFSENEIIVIKLSDISHQKAVMALLGARAEKKENAVVFASGVYLYLLCTEQNEEIRGYLSVRK